MRFAVSQLAGHQYRVKEGGHAQLVKDAESRWRMRQVREETEPVARFERGQHLDCARNRRSVIDKSRKVRFNSSGNARLLGLDLISQLLQGSADPEAVVRLFALRMGRLTEPSGCSTVDGDKSLRCDGKTTGLQAVQQSTHGLFAGDGAAYCNQGLKEVKPNGLDMLHDDVFPPATAWAEGERSE